MDLLNKLLSQSPDLYSVAAKKIQEITDGLRQQVAAEDVTQRLDEVLVDPVQKLKNGFCHFRKAVYLKDVDLFSKLSHAS